MTIVLHFYPNGEFSQGVDTSSSRPLKAVRIPTHISPQTSEYTYADIQKCHEQNQTIPAQMYSQVGSTFRSRDGQVYTLVSNDAQKCTLKLQGNSTESNVVSVDTSIYRLVHLGLLIPLVYQSVESCENPKSRKKLTSMSKAMSRNIRNGVYLLEQEPGGKDVLSFLTLTLPNLSTEGLASCCENWDSMVKRFFDWLRVSLKNQGLELKHVYCTEIQTKRLTNRGEYAPHLHVVFQGRKSRRSAWVITPKKARQAWSRCIRAFVNERFDDSALENLQRIKHSAARYLSKYLSKGANIIPGGAEENPIQSLKTQWGGMARAISESIRKNTQRYTSAGKHSWIALCILNNMEKLLDSGHVLYFKRGFISLGSDRSTGLEYGLHVGCGCLSTPTYQNGLLRIMEFLHANNCVRDFNDL